MRKTFSYKLYRTKNTDIFDQQINISANVWNHCIALHKRYYKLYGKYLNMFKLQKHLTKLKKQDKYAHWNLIPSQAFQNITERIHSSYKLFFHNVKHKIKCSPPKFCSYKKYKSITLKNAGYKLLENNKIKIGKKIYKFSKSREIEGEIKTITIKRNRLGEYFIYFSCIVDDFNQINRTMTGKSAGIDFGLKTFLTFNDGSKEDSPLFYFNSKNRIKKLNKIASRKKKGSNHKKQAHDNLFREHRTITNKRKDHQFKLAKKLTEEYDYIFIETLNIEAIKKMWGQKISDLSFSTFINILQYQASKNGCVVHKIDKWFPSSKICNNCGTINKYLTLSDRTWKCDCGVEHDRDINAAINILREGASSLGLDNVIPDNISGYYCMKPESQLL